MKWRILKSNHLGSARNMAIDEAILEGVIKGYSLPTIRFYGWNPATVSCGYNQNIEKEIDLKSIEDAGYGFVRRPTGGRLVLHEDEVTYSVVAKCSGRLGGNVTESYFEISKALQAGFYFLGVEVELERGSLSSAHQRQDVNPCFASSSRFELNYNRQKIVGSAQVRRENVLLQHGSILLDHDQSALAYLTPGLTAEKKDRLATFLKRKTIAINQVLDTPISFFNAVEKFIDGFRHEWSNDAFEISDKLLPEEEKAVEFFIYSKYLTTEWNNRK